MSLVVAVSQASRIFQRKTSLNFLGTNNLNLFLLYLFFSGYHPHIGCTKNSQKMKAVFKRPGLAEAKTDYQHTYTLHDGAKPRNARKPLPRLRNPNPPPMDFRTVQRTEYIPRKPDPQGTCKVTCVLNALYSCSNTMKCPAFLFQFAPSDSMLRLIVLF